MATSPEVIAAVRRMLEPMLSRVKLMVARGEVKLVDDTKRAQELQVSLLAGELRDGLEHLQSYGFTAHPHPGAEAVCVFIGGNRDHGFAVQVEDRRYRIKELAQGEVVMYDDLGSKVHLQRGGKIQVTAPTEILLGVGASSIKITTAKITITAPAIDLVQG